MVDIGGLIFGSASCGIVASHHIQDFFRVIWEDNVEFIRHLLGDIIKLVLAMLKAKFIIVVAGYIFTEKPPMIGHMETASYIGIFILFIIGIIINIYSTIKKLKNGDVS